VSQGGARPGSGRKLGTGVHDAKQEIRAPAERLKRYRAAAKRAGVKFSAWVREALEEKLARERKA
jgi:hypothetical protein